MRLLSKIVLMSLLLSIGLIQGGNALAQEKTEPIKPSKPTTTETLTTPEKQTPTTTKQVIDGASINFPDVEGWKKGEIFQYPDADLGYSVNYESEKGGRVTIYVYNSGYTAIPNDVSNGMFTMEMSTAKNDIMEFQKRGYYQDVKEIASDKIMLGGEKGKVNSLHTLFNITVRDQSMESEIYLFPYKNNFIKIRATRPNRDGGKQNEAVAKLLAELDALFSK